MIGFPDWQVAVETAQVLAGIVEYPRDNPFYVYHAKLWTVVHQVLAALLWAGMSEISLSTLVSGLLGMVSFQALSLFVYALSDDFLLAVGTPCLIFFSRIAELGTIYPIFLLGTPHTYGVLGLSLAVLTVALLGAGYYRIGAFLLGAGPAIHPSIGLWLAVIVGLSLPWTFGSMRDDAKRALPYFAAGAAAAGISLGLHLGTTYDAPPIDPKVAAQYLSAFVSLWDAHRQPISAGDLEVRVNAAALALAWIGLKGFSAQLRPGAVFMLRIVIVSALVSLVLVVVTWLPPDRLPPTLLILMPLRILNIDAMIAAPFLIGLAVVDRRARWGRWLALFLAAGLFVGNRSMLWMLTDENARAVWSSRVDSIQVLEIGALVLAGVAAYRAVRRKTYGVERRAAAPDAGSARKATSVFLERAAPVPRLMTLGVLLCATALTWRFSASGLEIFRDRTNDPLFRAVSENRGLLLTGANLYLVQLRTRRPLLLNGGGLDGLPYSIEAAPATDRILRDVYGIDLFKPPAEALKSGVIPSQANELVWEGYTRRRWQEIKRTYGVTQVLAYDTWSLDLPVAAQGHGLRLHDIPD
jgi:hypothetical protein